MIRAYMVAAVLLSGVATPSLADETKKVDFTTAIVVDGVPVVDEFKCPVKPDGKRDCETPLTVGQLAYFALQKPQPNQSWADGIKRNDLAHSIRTATDYPLLADQVVTIENAIGPMGISNGILGAVRDVIDPKGK